MRIGPLSELDASSVQQLLQKHNSSCEILLLEEDLSLALANQVQEHRDHQISSFPTKYLTAPKCLYLEIKTEDLLILKPLLEKLGVNLARPEKIIEIKSGAEFICYKCRYTQEVSGYCQKHPKIKLVPYEELTETKNKSRQKMELAFIIGLIVFFIVIINYPK